MVKTKTVRPRAVKKTVKDYERDRRQILILVPRLRKIKKGCR